MTHRLRVALWAGLAAAVVVVWVSGAGAYTLEQAARPAETPPVGYAGEVFVDSRGCLYVRAQIGARVNWVPRLSRDRQSVICGMSPASALPATAAEEGAEGGGAGDVTRAAPGDVAGLAAPGGPRGVRSLDLRCPAPGSSARIRLGEAVVTVRCTDGMTQPAVYVVTHETGGQTRLLVHPQAGGRAPTANWTGAIAPPAPAAPASAPEVAHVADPARHPSAGAEPGPHMVISQKNPPEMALPAAYQPAPGLRFVQIGAFRRGDNAARALAQLQNLGFAPVTAETRSGLTLVMAGPFTDQAALRQALRVLRAEYPDAYTRG